MAKKALLMILDGWGIGNRGRGDVIYRTPTPYLDYLCAVSAHSQLKASGEDVGLPDGQMGNSEVGHLNIGAGRVVYQDLVKINRACQDGSILKNNEIVSAFSYAQKTGKKLHLLGLTSNGGVHSSLDHLFKLIEISKAYGLKNTFVHCFMDGRDTDPRSGVSCRPSAIRTTRTSAASWEDSTPWIATNAGTESKKRTICWLTEKVKTQPIWYRPCTRATPTR